YTPILAECPANQSGVTRKYTRQGYVLDNIHDNDWAMYAAVEFGNGEYDKTPDSLKVIASCAGAGGSVQVWLDSLDTGDKIAECAINNTGDLSTFQTFASAVKAVSGRHDVYLKFIGQADKIFQLQWFYFTAQGDPDPLGIERSDSVVPEYYGLEQNYPNPFNASTRIRFHVPCRSFVSLQVYNLLGEEIGELAGTEFHAGEYPVLFDASQLASGIYCYMLRANDFVQTKKMIILR
ncbi:MAG: carbohydrate-binding protein, partial [Calditrichaeota bacterium]